MGKKNFEEQLRDYQRRVKNWFNFIKGKKGTQFNKEQNTTVKFVVPLLNILGWNYPFEDMEFEYFTYDKNKKVRHVDIALYTQNNKDSKPKILIEVKPIQNETVGGTTEIFRYLKGSKVNYGITTNGRELIIFDKRKVKSTYNRGRRLFSLKLEDFIDYSDVLWILSKDMVKKGVLDKLAKAYYSKEYWKWRKKGLKTGDPIHNDYKLPLKFARNFLRSKNYQI